MHKYILYYLLSHIIRNNSQRIEVELLIVIFSEFLYDSDEIFRSTKY
jgi:hypothetical protein